MSILNIISDFLRACFGLACLLAADAEAGGAGLSHHNNDA
jgi:hypothetical protein